MVRWLKAQTHLKDYHENLQLALEVSSFYQQADNIICSITNMVIISLSYIKHCFFVQTPQHIQCLHVWPSPWHQFKRQHCFCASKNVIYGSLSFLFFFFQRKSLSRSNGAGEIRDIASQIMVREIQKPVSSYSDCDRPLNSLLTALFVFPSLVFFSVWFQMLDVTVSQLSNLHPALAARVIQKQSEMKDCWALFQKTVR